MSKVFLVEECGVEERDSIQRRAIFLVFKNRDRERESKRYALSLRGCCLGAIRPLFLAPSLPQAPFFSYLSLACLLACLLYVGSNARQRCRVRERENQRDRSLWWGAGARKTVTHRLSGGNRNVLPPSGAESVSSSFSLSVAVKVFFFFSSSFFFFVLCLHSFGAPASVSTSRRSVRFCQCFDPVHACSFIRSLARSLDPSTHPSVRKSFYRSAFRGLLCPRVRTGGRGQ